MFIPISSSTVSACFTKSVPLSISPFPCSTCHRSSHSLVSCNVGSVIPKIGPLLPLLTSVCFFGFIRAVSSSSRRSLSTSRKWADILIPSSTFQTVD